MGKKIVYTPLSWSVSRFNLLKYCQKKYFFNYYGNWLKEFDETIRLKCLMLKNFKNLNMWFGEKVHNLISDYLKSIYKDYYNVNEEYILKNIKKEMTEEYENSKYRNYENYDKYNKFGLIEHYYGNNIDEKFDYYKNMIEEYFYNFLNSDLHKTIISYLNYTDKFQIEDKEVSFDKMKFYSDMSEIKNITLWGQPDLGIMFNEDKFIIYDWKTGKKHNTENNIISDQLKVYAYKILLNLGIEKTENIKIEAYEVYLDNMEICGGEITNNDIIELKEKIIKDVLIQKQYIVDEDINKNIPQPTHLFNRTDNIKKCYNCVFWDVCKELKEYEP